MSDLINREDAIERFCEFGTSLERQGKTLITMVDAKYAFIETLESLPSAEADWIPCSEMLPKEGRHVLVTRVDGEVGCVIWETWWYTQTRYPNKRPVAWMPLPKPYTEEGEVEK